jgi:hypothetical protein
MDEGVEVEIESLGDGGGSSRLAHPDSLQHGVKIAEVGIHLEALGSGRLFEWGAETGSTAHQVRALGGLPDGEEAPGGGPGHGPVVAVRDGAQRLVDVLNEFRKVERELSRGVGGPGIDHDHRVGAGVRADRPIARFVLRFVPVEPVDDRVPGGARCGVGGRQVDPVSSRAGHDHRAVGSLLGLNRGASRGLSRRRRCDENQKISHS